MKDHFKNIFKYDAWANAEIVNCLAQMDTPPQKAISLMSHIINAQVLWLSRITNVATDVKVWQDYDKNELPDKLKESSKNLIEFINTLDQEGLKKVITYTNTKGEKFESALTDILNQLSHHSAYHRGQIALLVKPLVGELPITDYIHFARKIKNQN